ILDAAVLLAPLAALGQSPVTPASSVSVAIDVRQEALATQPIGANWPSYHGDYSGQRYSGLVQINLHNVSTLRAQWAFHAPNSDALEVTPIVLNGLMIVSSANDAY